MPLFGEKMRRRFALISGYICSCLFLSVPVCSCLFLSGYARIQWLTATHHQRPAAFSSFSFASTQKSPLRVISFFQKGAWVFNISIINWFASNAAPL